MVDHQVVQPTLLAQTPDKLKALKDKLDRNRLTTSLFDANLFTENLEIAYELMYKRYQSGLEPDHFEICEFLKMQ